MTNLVEHSFYHFNTPLNTYIVTITYPVRHRDIWCDVHQVRKISKKLGLNDLQYARIDAYIVISCTEHIKATGSIICRQFRFFFSESSARQILFQSFGAQFCPFHPRQCWLNVWRLFSWRLWPLRICVSNLSAPDIHVSYSPMH